MFIGKAFLPVDDDVGFEVVEMVEVVGWTGTVILGNMVDIAPSVPQFLEIRKKRVNIELYWVGSQYLLNF